MSAKTSTRHRVVLPIKKKGMDMSLFYTILCLFVVGLIILSSASMAVAYKNHGSIVYYTLRQIAGGGFIGLLAFLVCQWMPYRIWKKCAVPVMAVAFILTAFIFFPQLSYSAGGATRWLNLGFFSVQPSEILKFGFIVYVASWLDARRKDIRSLAYGAMPFILMVSIIGVFLMMQKDMGTFGVIVATAAILYFVGGGKKSQIAAMFVLALIAGYLLIQMSPYRLARVATFLDPTNDPRGHAYQINQALIAIGTGGFSGRGFGQSIQKYNYLPEPMTDSIFAIFAEEMGFIGVVALVSLFGFFLWRSIIIAKYAPDAFGRLLATGLVGCIISQAFINMAAISGILPLTGITLPFISLGGTSLAVSMGMAGILLNISKHT